MSGQKTFSKNLARETTYKVKFKDTWKNKKMRNLQNELRGMFDDVLGRARGNDYDLGRVIISHPELNNSIVVPLDNWSNINSQRVMDAVENVLNSDENLPLDTAMQVTIGSIAVPSGSGTIPITRLKGTRNSIALKKSLLQVSNNDEMCMATAIGRCFLKLCEVVPLNKWREITKDDDPNMNTFQKVLKHGMTTKSYYKHVSDSAVNNKSYSKTMALTLCKEANLPTDKPLSIRDIHSFENLLDLNILVLSSKLGNKFYRVANNSQRKNIYLYLTGDADGNGHYDAIGSINGYFGFGYFCSHCLTPYKNKGRHSCSETCDVCGSHQCKISNDQVTCSDCHRTCRSEACYKRHNSLKTIRGHDCDKSMCERFYQCETCKKVLERNKRAPEQHRCGEWKCKNCFQYQLGDHLCYQRKSIWNSSKKEPRKYFFYDFETTQNEQMVCSEGHLLGEPCEKQCSTTDRCKKCKMCTNCYEVRCRYEEQCSNGYVPSQPCKTKCAMKTRCNSCKICINCHQSWCGLNEHKVNFAVLQSTCTLCENDDLTINSKCDVCGSRCENCRIVKKNKRILPCKDGCGYRQRVFRGNNVPYEFCSHIMTPHYKNTVLIAHNAKGFDNYPLLNALIDHHSVKPDKIIFDGSKIVYMHVSKNLDLTFLDSINFINMKLSKIPQCFGLQELQKGHFPHLFNTQEHQSYKGPYPAASYYGVDYMGEEEAQLFWNWYRSKENEIFDFQSEMYNYCVSDVDILRRGCMEFRKIMIDVTSVKDTNEKGEIITHAEGIDPFNYITIASVCQAIYRQLFLEEEYETCVTDLTQNTNLKCPSKFVNGSLQVQLPDGEWVLKETIDASNAYTIGRTVFVKSPIAVVPSEGYVSRDNFSKVSIQWLEWTMERSRRSGKPIHIQHALNGRGEHKVPGTNFRLDGYVHSPKKTAYEFLGCCFHGCPSCFPHDRTKTTHPKTKHSMAELYIMTKQKERELIRLGYEYVCIWEHEFHQLMSTDDQMRELVSTLDITDRLNVRDSFYGGRTNGIKLYHECAEPGETIEYYDFTSLYPSVNKYAKYPIGHPVIITSNFQDISKYFGVVKVKILPHRRLFHPVLPYVSNGKLKFPLCKKCADDENQNDCTCTNDERAIVGTWCTPEVELALSKGYEILKIYEVYHFEEFKKHDPFTGVGGLFDAYVNLFLKFKQEASGFPQECKTDQEKMEYIADYAKHEGIHLDYDNIKKNPGLRSLAKICLNSFWGKFGQRLNMRQTAFFHEHEGDKFFQLLSDPRKDVKDFHIISKDFIQIEHVHETPFIPIDVKTNIFIASFTTCWARIKLYNVMEQVGHNTLYVDTDSIIFCDKDKIISKTLPIGNYLGQLTNEISPEDKHITHFVAGGPKNYAYRLASGNEKCKVRGFSLDNKMNSDLINFSSICDVVVNKTIKTIKTTNPRKISRLACKRKLYNRIEEKEYRMVYTKRRLLNDLTTLPFGYCCNK
ncbi:Hypothetical predicted protein [Mytilus galloprovincialis]|uniref:DNA-directed DNA polymerase n=1 Tax=Mytilus galloprovincialis TaxID=29158 RepID=A0A8B6G0W0_MYTGA|nr:Hypothetical predicted protein [Mytilus galloprovincialis]